MSNPTTPAAMSTLQLIVEADVRHARQFTATDGANAGRTYFTADAELSTPGSRWSTVRIKVRSAGPIAEGHARLSVVKLDQNEGVAVADLVVEGK